MKTLKEEIKKSKISITELHDEFEVSRQMIYNYIEMYDKGEFNKIRSDVCKRFNEIMNREPNKENTSTYKNKIRELHEKINKEKFKNQIISDKIAEYEKNKCMVAALDKNGEYVEKDYTSEIDALKKLEKNNNDNIEKLKKEIEKILIEYGNETDEPIDQQIAKIIIDGKYSGPSWTRSIQNLKTLCVADSGNYMVITDDTYGMKTVLKLFAIISGVREQIAQYDFKENERFIKFNLIPKLIYYYEVVQYGTDGIYSSGILELKNFD